MKRVVVTGLGCITPIGNSVEVFRESLYGGSSGIAPFDPNFPGAPPSDPGLRPRYLAAVARCAVHWLARCCDRTRVMACRTTGSPFTPAARARSMSRSTRPARCGYHWYVAKYSSASASASATARPADRLRCWRRTEPNRRQSQTPNGPAWRNRLVSQHV